MLERREHTGKATTTTTWVVVSTKPLPTGRSVCQTAAPVTIMMQRRAERSIRAFRVETVPTSMTLRPVCAAMELFVRAGVHCSTAVATSSTTRQSTCAATTAVSSCQKWAHRGSAAADRLTTRTTRSVATERFIVMTASRCRAAELTSMTRRTIAAATTATSFRNITAAITKRLAFKRWWLNGVSVYSPCGDSDDNVYCDTQRDSRFIPELDIVHFSRRNPIQSGGLGYILHPIQSVGYISGIKSNS